MTAKECLIKHITVYNGEVMGCHISCPCNAMIEFAKHHVKLALEAAALSAYFDKTDYLLILNSYNLDNIK